MHILQVYSIMKQHGEWQEDPGSQSEKDKRHRDELQLHHNKVSGFGPVFKPQYSSLLSGVQFFTHCIGERGVGGLVCGNCTVQFLT